MEFSHFAFFKYHSSHETKPLWLLMTLLTEGVHVYKQLIMIYFTGAIDLNLGAHQHTTVLELVEFACCLASY